LAGLFNCWAAARRAKILSRTVWPEGAGLAEVGVEAVGVEAASDEGGLSLADATGAAGEDETVVATLEPPDFSEKWHTTINPTSAVMTDMMSISKIVGLMFELLINT